MSNKSEILNELNEISPPLALLNKTEVYNVPHNYFYNFSDTVLSRIKSFQNTNDSDLSGMVTKLNNINIGKQNVYNIPHNYFDNFPDTVLSKIKSSQNANSNELPEIAPVLNSIGKQNVYTVPNNYFEAFKVNIPAENATAKIVPIKTINRFLKYAVAAVFVGIIFTGGFLYNHYKTNSTANIAKAMKKVSDDELDKYADEYGIQLNYDSLTDEDDSELNIASELKSVSNEELEQYYNEHLQVSSSQEN